MSSSGSKLLIQFLSCLSVAYPCFCPLLEIFINSRQPIHGDKYSDGHPPGLAFFYVIQIVHEEVSSLSPKTLPGSCVTASVLDRNLKGLSCVTGERT